MTLPITCMYHVGNAYEMHSIVQSGVIPGGKSNRRDRQPVFFTAVNPMDDNQDLEEKSNAIWTNPESNRINTLGKPITIQYIGAI